MPDFPVLPPFRKISAVIPLTLFFELQRRGLFNNDFDRWLAEAILEKMRNEDWEAEQSTTT